MDRLHVRLGIALPLFLAGYTVLQCPCNRLPKCKQSDFFLLILMSVLISLVDLCA